MRKAWNMRSHPSLMRLRSVLPASESIFRSSTQICTCRLFSKDFSGQDDGWHRALVMPEAGQPAPLRKLPPEQTVAWEEGQRRWLSGSLEAAVFQPCDSTVFNNLCVACSTLSSTLSFPSTSRVSNSGGEAVRPVTATRIGVNICPAFTPNSFAASRKA